MDVIELAHARLHTHVRFFRSLLNTYTQRTHARWAATYSSSEVEQGGLPLSGIAAWGDDAHVLC